MNPQEELDPQAVNLAKAIRAVETGSQKDPYTAKGASGEHGAYQFTKPTWEKASMKYLGRVVPLESATREEQNEVAYKQIKEFKDQGYNPAQIASLWNSGKPDAYTDPNYKGVNKYGVKYDVPAYVDSVYRSYQSIKGNGEPTITPVGPSTVGQEQYGNPPEPKKTGIDSILNGKVSQTIQKIFPGQKVGQAIGTLGGFLKTKAKDIVEGTDVAKNYDLSAPTPLQVAGDVAQGALMVGGGLPEKGATTLLGKEALGAAKGFQTAKSGVGRIIQNSLLGAGIGAAGGVSEGKNIHDVAEEAKAGGIAGGVLGTAGEVLNLAARSLPKRFLRSNVGKINDETAEYAVKKGLKVPSKMLKESEDSVKTISGQIEKKLTDSATEYTFPSGEEFLTQVANQFPDAGLGPKDVAATLYKMVPLKKNLVDKLIAGSITPKELWQLNSAIGKSTYKTVFDDPTVKAGKEIGNAFYQVSSKYIKDTFEGTAPLFDDLSKEIQLRNALDVAINRMGKHKAFNLRDLMAIIGGGSIAGPLGAAGAFLGEKFVTSPSANLVTGGLLHKLGGSAGAIKPLILKGITSNVNNK